MNTKNVFLVGSKSLGMYGGYETFVYNLLKHHKTNKNIKYHVACKLNGVGRMDISKLEGVSDIIKAGTDIKSFTFENAHCFMIKALGFGSNQAVFYDIMALEEICRYIKKNNIKDSIVYIMACRIGPVMKHYKKKINKLGGKVYLNPDGHEWKRSKWSLPVRQYWKMSERQMVKNSDLVICDSINIEKYINKMYGKYNISTTFIPYGAYVKENVSKTSDKFDEWARKNSISKDNYYLMVGRFVPENNYEVVIREFIKSSTNKELIIITTENEKFMEYLQQKLNYKADKRIKFVGTVYDHELLIQIRENAFAYIHGHEVGGTNPSLLESLASTRMSLLLDVCFNKEVGQDAGLYWSKEEGSLAELIDNIDEYSVDRINEYEKKSKNRIKDAYSWDHIADEYERIFLGKR